MNFSNLTLSVMPSTDPGCAVACRQAQLAGYSSDIYTPLMMMGALVVVLLVVRFWRPEDAPEFCEMVDDYEWAAWVLLCACLLGLIVHILTTGVVPVS